MVSPEPQRIDQRQESMDRPWSGRLRQSKLRRPTSPPGSLPRPRLLSNIDDGQRPLTLIVAPSGFGKSTVAAEWAGQTPRAAWLTVDPRDASLSRFWAHLREALGEVAPGFGELVHASFAMSHRASAADLGRMLADELLDAAAPVRLVIDDFHLIPESETHAFLNGLFEIAPPGLQVVITARFEPPLSLARLRLRGALRELHSADLLFTEEETRALVASTGPSTEEHVTDRQAVVLWKQTQGWAAGLRLAVLALADGTEAASATAGVEAAALLASLLDETLASRSPTERSALLRAALPNAFDAHLVAALVDGGETTGSVAKAIHFALAADLCRPSTRYGGAWLEFHPLFQEGLRRSLEREESAQMLTSLHARAAAWFEAAGMADVSVGHHLASGEIDRAIAMVEQEIQPAFNREDWSAVARWLALLPDETVWDRLSLLLAKGWVAHLRGRATQLQDIVRAIGDRIARDDYPPPARRAVQAELDLMLHGTTVPVQIDPERSLAVAQAAIETLPSDKRFQLGLAWTLLGMALQACGRGDDAVERLTWWSEISADRIDAGSIRGLFGLLFVHWQAASLSRVESAARTMHDIASRQRLRLAAAWGSRFLGDVLYERGELAGATAHYAAVARDYEHFHLTGVREAHLGLALSSVATGRTAEGWRTLRRARDILLDAGALEHLPALEAYEAYLAWRSGDLLRALEWARAKVFGVDEATFYLMVHPTFIRAAILCSDTDAASLDEASALLAALRRRAVRAHFIGPLVRINALAAIAHVKRGEHADGAAAMRRSLATGRPEGYVRTYLDLLPVFAAELTQLAASLDVPPALRAALDAPDIRAPLNVPPKHGAGPMEGLTTRERDVLAALSHRLSYKEIADQLFISPATVKRHASSVYSKLGVAGRNEAIRLARDAGWQP